MKLLSVTLAALLVRASGVVAVDTGLGHLSAAMGVPAVSLYGPTSPSRVGAYGANQSYLVGEIDGEKSTPEELMASIRPESVWAELQSLMSG